VIREDAVKIGINFLSSGKAKRLVVVYQNSIKEKILGWPSNYSPVLEQALEDLGLKKHQILVLEVPKVHPIALNEAKAVLSGLSNTGVGKAILLCEGFHTRRSLWAYRRIGLPLGLVIIPYLLFMRYQNDNWWSNVYGVGELFQESIKLVLLCPPRAYSGEEPSQRIALPITTPRSE